MILIDFNQISIAAAFEYHSQTKETDINENDFRHMFLNTVRKLNNKFGTEYGDIIFACDSKHNWRKKQFKNYKALRKKARDSSTINWDVLYSSMDAIKKDIEEDLPYKIVEIEDAEGDDVIAAIIMARADQEQCMIISADKDFIQLQQYPGVKQYDNIRDRFLTNENPKDYLIDMIIRGDRGDGIPNILMDDDCFIEGRRQKPITKKVYQELYNQVIIREDPSDGEIAKNIERNSKLIDLERIPFDIRSKIVSRFEEQSNKQSKNLIEYFMKHNLRQLMENIGDFT